MATDADAPRWSEADARPSGTRDSGGTDRSRTDRQRADRSVDGTDDRSRGEGSSDPESRDALATPDATVRTRRPTPETLYLTRIAALEARVDALEAAVARKERDLQHVVDRYEHVLDGREDCRLDPPLAVAGGTPPGPGARPDDESGVDDRPDSADASLLDRLHALLR